jgi:long-chain fatty acid transport protein
MGELNMPTQISMKIIPAVLLAALSGTAAASGFQLLEQGSGLGNAYAGSAAKASDASTIFWNPAGMTQLQAREVSGGLTAVRPSFKFDDNGSQVGPTFGRANDGNDAGGWAYVPNGYLSWAVNKDLYLGLGIGAPFGLKTKYHSPWKGSAQSDEFDIKTININPSIAFRVNETVSLGAGVSWQKLEADYYRQAAIAPVGATGVTAHMKIDDDAWGWNIGALFTITPATKVGLSYRSAIQYHTDGNVKLTSDGSPAANATAAALRPNPSERRGSQYQGAGYLRPECGAAAQRPVGNARRHLMDGLELNQERKHHAYFRTTGGSEGGNTHRIV